jgi:hypothetical protein
MTYCNRTAKGEISTKAHIQTCTLRKQVYSISVIIPVLHKGFLNYSLMIVWVLAAFEPVTHDIGWRFPAAIPDHTAHI